MAASAATASFSFGGVLGYYRTPTVSGEQIVFNCEGDLWKVSTAGGLAMRLTSHPANEGLPHFSPDGKLIAFTADYQGSGNIYVMPSDGGEPRRLTYQPTRDNCLGWTPDGKNILFCSHRGGLDSESFLYQVPVDGGEPRKVNIGTCDFASYSADGSKLAFNQFFWSGTWKRYRGGTSPKIWIEDVKAATFREVTNTEQAVDQDPMFVGDRIYFLSERTFPVNVWSCKADGTDPRQVTHHADYDVRQAATDGKTITYIYGADLWLLDPATGQSKKIEVTIPSDRIRNGRRSEDASNTLDGYDLNDDGKHVVISSRGEIYTAPSKPGGRIVDVTHHSSGTRERSPVYSPDGKKICVITDETGEQELAIYDAAGKDAHKVLTKNGKGWLFQPVWSNDSKRIAFADLTGSLYIADAESGDVKLVDQDKNWEMTEYTFSPDSKWIAYSKVGDNRLQEVWISDLQGGKPFTISSGFTADYSPSWDMGGKYLFFLSDRDFDPILDSLDSEFIVTKTGKPCAVLLTKETKSPFLPDEVLDADKDEEAGDDASAATTQKSAATVPAATKPATTQAADVDKVDEVATRKDQKLKKSAHADKGNADAGDEGGDKKSKSKKDDYPEVKIDVEGIKRRQVEFPVDPANTSELTAAAEDKVFYVTSPTRGLLGSADSEAGGDKGPHGTLHVFDLKKKKDDVFYEGVDGYALSRDGTRLAWKDNRDIVVVDANQKPEPGKPFDEKVSLKSLPLIVDVNAEWKQIYNEAWRLQRDFYWADNMVGLDWPAMKEKYGKLLPRVSSRAELNDLIAQLISELGTSHTYVYGGDFNFAPPAPIPTGVLGADVELDEATGLHKFVKVLRPEPWETDIESPLTMTNANVQEGDFLIAVNGHELAPNDNVDAQLEDMAEVQVQLTVASKGDKSDARDIQIQTMSDDTELRYADWCRRNREYVEKRSEGKIGYFHLPDMEGAGLAKFVKGFYPQTNKDALIIDDRDNHGGFVSQMMIERLSRKVWAHDQPRRGMGSTYPSRAHVGYKCVLINEQAGSDGDIFPDSFKTLGLGPVIGKRTWGGVIGIRSDKGFVDAGMSTQPEFAWWDEKRGWSVENHGVDPDIEVEYSPADWIAGVDPQLERGVAEMLRMLKEKPLPKAVHPPLPIRVPRGATTMPSQN